MADGQRIWGDTLDGATSSIGTQINPSAFHKQALLEIVKERPFGQLADVRAMPKNQGKEIKQFHYMPILDSRNTNDQGLDANGVSIKFQHTLPIRVQTGSALANVNAGELSYFYAQSDTALNAKNEAETKGLAFINQINADNADALNVGDFATYAAAIADVESIANLDFPTAVAESSFGNLYGSSKDPGLIVDRMPNLREEGGDVNRVGVTRRTLTGTISKYGIHDKYTKESMDFDTDAGQMMHITREMVRGANELVEDQLQIELLTMAGRNVSLAGSATKVSELNADGIVQATIDSVASPFVTYDDLLRLSVTLDEARCPKASTIITGTRFIDTRVIPAARYIYVGPTLVPHLHNMKDYFGNKAFVSTEHYASGTAVAVGEIGSIGYFRVILALDMISWKGAGAEVTNNTMLADNDGLNYTVHPMMVVGSGSFTNIGFQSSGKSVKFKIKHAPPESPESYSRDVYGETGFYSIKWYHGFMELRSEWSALIKTLAY